MSADVVITGAPLREPVMILNCLASDYYATAFAEVYRQRLSIETPNGDLNLKLLIEDRSSKQIPPRLDTDHILQRQPLFVATSHKHLKPTKEVSDSLLKLLVPHLVPYARKSVSSRGALPTVPRYSRAKTSALLEVPSVLEQTNLPVQYRERLFPCSVVARRSCGPEISKPRDIMVRTYLYVSLFVCKTMMQ